MMTACDSVDDLTQRHPEWAPWLAVVGLAVEEMENAAWDRMRLLPSPARDRTLPLLSRAVLEVDPGEVRRLLRGLDSRAREQGSDGAASIDGLLAGAFDPLPLLEAALNRDRARLEQFAGPVADADALAALLSLGVKPLFHACRRRCGDEVAASSLRGYCPICAGWPAFAEVRGVERTRHLRCGDCGHGWAAIALKCPFCGTDDHDMLESLVSDERNSIASIDVCNRCRGYVKVFTTLRGASPAQVLVRALATSELDIAALHMGYRGPPCDSPSLELEVAAIASRRTAPA